MKRRKRRYSAASLSAFSVADGTDDPIAELLLQARQRGLQLTTASAVDVDTVDAARSPASQQGAVGAPHATRQRVL